MRNLKRSWFGGVNLGFTPGSYPLLVKRRALNRPAHFSEGLRPHASKPGGLRFNEHGGSAPCESRRAKRLPTVSFSAVRIRAQTSEVLQTSEVWTANLQQRQLYLHAIPLIVNRQSLIVVFPPDASPSRQNGFHAIRLLVTRYSRLLTPPIPYLCPSRITYSTMGD